MPHDAPVIAYDPTLPISGRLDDIQSAIRDHQVVVVAGETGSGKTTQLPKMCLQLGLHRIGHTQPRRIAARTVAERIAEEMRCGLGDLVGYQVRFTRKATKDTRIKVMTDGVLLAEITHDRELRRYDCLIIDEAHERSLNIDFLLGYLKQLLPRRPDLKVIITSATIDTERFANHFADAAGVPAPIVEVSGRTYPVEIRYRPWGEDDPASERTDQLDAIAAAVTELYAEGAGDILVFLSGEREIRDTAEMLAGLDLRFLEVLPLYARLSAAEQHRVFTPHTGTRIVLATNVAETSLTVPGIRSVIDPGTARISRWSARTKVQRLPIEPISQASANQRAGRCGRVAPGVCIRLYSEENFAARDEFTAPEIMRTNLASVILQMADSGLGDIASFPFVEAPDSSQISDGIRLLDELGALKPHAPKHQPRLTRIGHQLSRIPLDPRMARMLLEAQNQGCLTEMLIIVSGMTIQDPRERPDDFTEQADAAHRRFWAPLAEPGSSDQTQPTPDGSDFMALLRLWDYLQTQRKALSGNGFRRMCRQEFLNFLRIREWQDLHQQLREISRDLKLERNHAPASADRIHVAILAGLLSHIGLADVREEKKRSAGGNRRRRGPREYLGARGARFAINPGSSVARVQPELVMAGELVETTRLWARTVAGIEASWVEEVGAHLLRRNYSEPHWSMRSGSVRAYEKVSLLGVPIIAQRPVNYARIDPVASRQIFIRSALVEGEWHTRHHFFARNAETRRQAEKLEERTRRRDLLVDDQAIYEFYDARIPGDIVSAQHFDSWWRVQRKKSDDYLDLKLADLIIDDDAVRVDDFPDQWPVGEHSLEVSYVFEPGAGHDGVTVAIELGILNQVPAAPFTWQVPGLRTELATELIRSLPKQVRTRLVPAPDRARQALAWLETEGVSHDRDLALALGTALRALTGEVIEASAWRTHRVDPHLEVSFEVVDPGKNRRVIARGKDLRELQRQLGREVSATLTRASTGQAVSGATGWNFSAIERRLEVPGGGRGYPGLVDEGNGVGVVVHENATAQAYAHRRGLRRLVTLNTPDPTKWVVSHLRNDDKLALGNNPYPSVPDLLADARLKSVGDLIDAAVDPADVRDREAFARLCDRVRADNADRMRAVVGLTADMLRTGQRVRLALGGIREPDVVDDVREQLDNLLFEGFIAVTDEPHFTRMPVYLQAIEQRLRTLSASPARERQARETIWALEDAYADLCSLVPPGALPEEVAEIGWLIEEMRVSLFAQGLGTRTTVSKKRVLNAIVHARGHIDTSR